MCDVCVGSGVCGGGVLAGGVDVYGGGTHVWWECGVCMWSVCESGVRCAAGGMAVRAVYACGVHVSVLGV